MIKIPKYYDWWFDNAIEFLGYLLERLNVKAEWNDGISFPELNNNQVNQLVERIEELIEPKLKYKKKNENGLIEIKNRAYLPTMHKGKYVNFLRQLTSSKRKIVNSLFADNFPNRKQICDICSRSYDDQFKISKAAQIVYPTITSSLSSQSGIRKIQPDYLCCPLCAFLGCIEWLDDIPFACDHGNLTHYLLFPNMENLPELHKFKNIVRQGLTQRPYSNVISMKQTSKGEEFEAYTADAYSLLLSLFENMALRIKVIKRFENIFMDKWIYLRIKGMDATYQTKYTYSEEIKIPNIKNLEEIFKELQKPYSNFIDKSFATPVKREGVSKEIIYAITRENKYLMSKGIILDDFKTFSKAFQIRQNCTISVNKEMLDKLVKLWRCKND